MTAYTVIGIIDLMENRVADAQQSFERVIKMDPRSAVAANNLAWLRGTRRRRRHGAAARFFRWRRRNCPTPTSGRSAGFAQERHDSSGGREPAARLQAPAKNATRPHLAWS